MFDLFVEKIIFDGNIHLPEKEIPKIIVTVSDVFRDLFYAEIEIITHVYVIENIVEIIVSPFFVFQLPPNDGKHDFFHDVIENQLKHGAPPFQLLITFFHHFPYTSVFVPIQSVFQRKPVERKTDIN